MNNDRELMQQALDALELVADLTNHDDEVYAAIDALRERLAQPVQEPVAVVVDPYDTPGFQWLCQHPPKRGDRLYAAPPWSTVHAAVKRAIDQCKAASGMHRAIDLVVNATQITHEAMGTDTANSITGETQ